MNNPADTLAALAPCPFCGGEARLYGPTCNRHTPYNPADRAFPVVRCGCGAQIGGRDWDQRGTSAIAAWNRRASLKGEAEPRKPDGYAYRYPRHDGDTVIRFTCGQEINGARPIEAVPYFYGTPPDPQAVEEDNERDEVLALLAELARALPPISVEQPAIQHMIQKNRREQALQKIGDFILHKTAKPSPAPQGGGEAADGWPDYVMLRDTNLHDDQGGLGQRIFTTAGAGYKKVKYVRADLATPPAQQPGEVGGVRVTHQMILRAQAAVPSRGDAPAIYYSETQAILEAALAPKEKGNG